jgi:predicted transcriptional regulator
LLDDVAAMQQAGRFTGGLIGAQRSVYHHSQDEYLCITLARPAYPAPDKNVSITLGIQVDAALRNTIRFLDDPAIAAREVNNTCERCPIATCLERAAPPTVIEQKNKKKKAQQILASLTEG